MKYIILLFIYVGPIKTLAQIKNLNFHLQDVETVFFLPSIKIMERFLSEKGLYCLALEHNKSFSRALYESKLLSSKTQIIIINPDHSNEISSFEIHSEDTLFIHDFYKDCETLGYKKVKEIDNIYTKSSVMEKIISFDGFELKFILDGNSGMNDSYITYFFYIIQQK